MHNIHPCSNFLNIGSSFVVNFKFEAIVNTSDNLESLPIVQIMQVSSFLSVLINMFHYKGQTLHMTALWRMLS